MGTGSKPMHASTGKAANREVPVPIFEMPSNHAGCQETPNPASTKRGSGITPEFLRGCQFNVGCEER